MARKVHSTTKPLKKPKKEKKVKPNPNPPGPASFPIPTGRPKPFTKSPQHAKWPALFKRHLGVIESHIRTLDRVMQSMRTQMNDMDAEERAMWERGEKGNWRVICGMMDRARATLVSAREAAQGILPSRQLREKKSLGAFGTLNSTNYEPLGAGEKGDFPSARNRTDDIHTDSQSSDTDSDESSEEDSDEEMSDAPEAKEEVVALNVGKKRKLSNEGAEKEAEEPNPYFVVDVNPTPVTIPSLPPAKKSRKHKDKDASDDTPKKSKKEKKAKTKFVEDELPKVDYAEIERQLQEEVQEGLRAKAAQEVKLAAMRVELEEKMKIKEMGGGKEKKRKRVSEGSAAGEVVGKKVKKEKGDKKEKKEKKRKAIEDGEGEVVGKIGGGDVGDAEGKKKKKKRKHEVEAEA